ncbi:VOC family protein [Chromobacterium sphagni]|uniref:Glyoxalase n=1 Tax=Chromobacterium sphagni TaxID=1903179 RepID=A0A1S1WSX5_9NEIS|nr:VOC family protein [Chromobacterium sphagni]OHX10367.1 glyoxalase [Chromobacterium sphagni]OHX17130.1 glyoxalase [Chromobacterium sphagni]
MYNLIPHLRVARPVSNLPTSKAMYCEGLGLQLLGSFSEHDGFDGIMLGLPGAGYHLEFIVDRQHPVPPTPTVEDLLVLYLPDHAEWQTRCACMRAAGFRATPSANPYWDEHGVTFVDHDGYRTVLQNAKSPV